MKKFKKYLALLLAGIMLSATLVSCQNGEGTSSSKEDGENTSKPTETTDVGDENAETNNSKPEETPQKQMLSPGALYDKMLEANDYKITSEIQQTVEGETTSMGYTLSKDNYRLQLDYLIDLGSQGTIEMTDYINLQLGRYYYLDEYGDWVYQEESDDFEIGTIEEIIAEVVQMDPEELFEDSNYKAFDEKNNRYEAKEDALLEGMEEFEDLSASVYMTTKDDNYVFDVSLDWNGESVEMEIIISFVSVSVKIPSAQPAQDEEIDIPIDPGFGDERVETPYTYYDLTMLLRGLTNATEAGMIDYDTIYSIGFTPWQNEGVENLFDGVKTEEQWYYDEDGFLKEMANPFNMEGGGPGKCAGVKHDSTIFIFGTTEEIVVSAYVITTGNDNEKYPYRNPIEWSLYGTNDPAALYADDFYSVDWALLDYVWEGGMEEYNFTSYGYTIDDERQGSYRYYALMLSFSQTNEFQACELELYFGESQGLPEQNPGQGDIYGREPYMGSALSKLLEGKTNVVADLGLLDLGNIRTYNFYPWNNEGPEHLFDGIKTEEQWYFDEDGYLKDGAMPGLMEGGGPGKCAGEIYEEACFFFALKEEAVLTAYVLTTGNDNEKYPYRNPYEWTLYGTNDPAAANCDYFFEADWEMLDFSWDGSMDEVNFASYGYTIDPSRQGSYKYYCLAIDYCISYQFQLGELELYIG